MISVILCGGAGSRLWPVSRELHPKPFLRLPDGQSFVQKAFLRGTLPEDVKEILTITNKELHFKILDEFSRLDVNTPTSYILEPFGRNTGPAIAMSALYICDKYGPDEPMLVLAADHLIQKQAEFAEAVAKAAKLARQKKLVVFGIQPTTPETGFGYIEADGTTVKCFLEKPSLDKAREYLAAGNYFWNAGIFCFTAGTLLAELKQHAPGLLSATESCFKASVQPGNGNISLNPVCFAKAPDISIDYALMEKSSNIAVVPCDIGWSDIGSWTALCELDEPDTNGNRISGNSDTLLDGVSNCDIQGQNRLIATIGLDNILIVDTDDALLVADKSKAQDVKRIYNQLKKDQREEYKFHRTVHRPWGSFTQLEVGPRFKIKRLVIKPGASISLQRHHHRSEHWVVVSGMAEVTCGDKLFFVDTNESTYIKAGNDHRVANRGIIDLVIIEVQSGDYLGEDDIIRIDDVYGRD